MPEPSSRRMVAEASARVLEIDDMRVGYVHLWYVQSGNPTELLGDLADGKFADYVGMILDLRGRGSSAMEASRLISMLHPEKLEGLGVTLNVAARGRLAFSGGADRIHEAGKKALRKLFAAREGGRRGRERSRPSAVSRYRVSTGTSPPRRR